MSRREEIIIRMWNAGAKRSEIAKAVCLSGGQVTYHIERLRMKGVDVPCREKPVRTTISDSARQQIIIMWNEGTKMQSIADSVGVHINSVKNVICRAREAGVELPSRANGNPNPRRTTVREIKRVVSELSKIPVQEMEGPRRTARVIKPRQIAMALAYKYSGSSLPQIGRLFGGRDHTTVLHAVRIAPEKYAAGYKLVEDAIIARIEGSGRDEEAKTETAGPLREGTSDQREDERERAGCLLRQPAHELDDRPS